MKPGRVVAFAPGRANLIGEHTDYNDGLSLPFAIEQGVTVAAHARDTDELVVTAVNHREQARFALAAGPPALAGGWRDFVSGAIAELEAAGFGLRGGELTIEADLPEGSGLSSSAALEVSVCLALIAMSGARPPEDVTLARLCSRVENNWVGARTGLLDQLASLLGVEGHALRIDFRTLQTTTVPLDLRGWGLVSVDSGESHSLAESGYNERRAECERAKQLLGLKSLRDALPRDVARLPDPLGRRVRHVIEENSRVERAVAALDAGDLGSLAALLDASHASLRDLFDASTEAVERTVTQLKGAGAAGVRMMGGGFGGQLIALLAPGVSIPVGARELTPSDGARLRELR